MSGDNDTKIPPNNHPNDISSDRMMEPSFVRRILQGTLPRAFDLDALSDQEVVELFVKIIGNPDVRERLPEFSTLADAVDLIRRAKNIIVVTGAGVSVSCGIPDFRSADGVYARLRHDFPDLPNPEAMFDIEFFNSNPRPFFQFAKELYPGQFKPSISHMFIKILEDQGKLLRNYTQNIDTLETVAGVKNVLECHGSFKTATCQVCEHKVGCNDIREDVLAQKVAICKKCETGVVKPDIVFFGEALPGYFHQSIDADKEVADLLIVMGSSMKVQPILINREVLASRSEYDIQLLGNCDVIVAYICSLLGGSFEERMATELKLRMRDYDIECSLSPIDLDELHKSAMDFKEKANRQPHDGPSAKRRRVSDGSDDMVTVGNLLSGAYVFNEPNITMFEGAQAFYDVQTRKFIFDSNCGSSTTTESSDDESDDDEYDRSYSEPPTSTFSDDVTTSKSGRCASAPPESCCNISEVSFGVSEAESSANG
uniref:NAD-dependent protein deacetylase sir-2.1 n=1 Tax=Steinernema glaseri TaxID=37863 RepID=A0A1I8AF16_9BILA